jgi:hypothetical protein
VIAFLGSVAGALHRCTAMYGYMMHVSLCAALGHHLRHVRDRCVERPLRLQLHSTRVKPERHDVESTRLRLSLDLEVCRGRAAAVATRAAQTSACRWRRHAMQCMDSRGSRLARRACLMKAVVRPSGAPVRFAHSRTMTRTAASTCASVPDQSRYAFWR